MKTIAKIITMLCIMTGIGQQYTYAQVSVGISVRIAPPVLPVYTQPECPVDGYIWQPGYWAYDNVEGYYWVPGIWIAPPNPGLYWTPAYWGYSGGYYGFYPGYWGPHVGYYGGINYGCGYNGYGYAGGRWDGGRFRYNTAVTRINRTVIRNTYIDRTVIINNNNRASYNGPGGINARPRPQELLAAKDRHIQATPNQLSHQAAARSDRNSFAKINHGRPATPAVKGTPANMGNGGQHNLNAGRQQAPNTRVAPTPGNRQQNQSPQQNMQRQQQRNPQQQHTQQRQQQPQQMQRQQQAQQRNAQQQHIQQRQQQPQQMQRQQQAQQQRNGQQQQMQQRQQQAQQQHIQQQRQSPPQRQQQAQQPHNEPHPGGGGEHGGGERR